MKTKNIAYAFAFVALSTVAVSCSEDDTTSNSLFDTKPLNITLSMLSGDVPEEGETSAAKPNRVSGTVNTTNNALLNTWSGEDVVYAWSPDQSKWNKLTGKADDKGENSKTFGCENAYYKDGERMVLYYSGNKTMEWSEDDETITLTRPANDNDLAYVYGAADATEHYSDANNPYSVKRGSSVVTDGVFTAGSNVSYNQLALVDAVSKIRLELPATAEKIEAMKALTYNIEVSLTGSDEEGNEVTGYPKSVVLTMNGKNTYNKPANWFKTFSSTSTWGDALKLTYSADGKDNKNTNLLWNTTADADDAYAGFIFIPLPADSYTALTVKVTVTNPNSVSGVDNVVGTHTYAWKSGESVAAVEPNMDASSTINKVYKTKPMWSFE